MTAQPSGRACWACRRQPAWQHSRRTRRLHSTAAQCTSTLAALKRGWVWRPRCWRVQAAGLARRRRRCVCWTRRRLQPRWHVGSVQREWRQAASLRQRLRPRPAPPPYWQLDAAPQSSCGGACQQQPAVCMSLPAMRGCGDWQQSLRRRQLQWTTAATREQACGHGGGAARQRARRCLRWRCTDSLAQLKSFSIDPGAACLYTSMHECEDDCRERVLGRSLPNGGFHCPPAASRGVCMLTKTWWHGAGTTACWEARMYKEYGSALRESGRWKCQRLQGLGRQTRLQRLLSPA